MSKSEKTITENLPQPSPVEEWVEDSIQEAERKEQELEEIRKNIQQNEKELLDTVVMSNVLEELALTGRCSIDSSRTDLQDQAPKFQASIRKADSNCTYCYTKWSVSPFLFTPNSKRSL